MLPAWRIGLLALHSPLHRVPGFHGLRPLFLPLWPPTIRSPVGLPDLGILLPSPLQLRSTSSWTEFVRPYPCLRPARWPPFRSPAALMCPADVAPPLVVSHWTWADTSLVYCHSWSKPQHRSWPAARDDMWVCWQQWVDHPKDLVPASSPGGRPWRCRPTVGLGRPRRTRLNWSPTGPLRSPALALPLFILGPFAPEPLVWTPCVRDRAAWDRWREPAISESPGAGGGEAGLVSLWRRWLPELWA